jgi:hypothetical protein
MLQTTSNAMVHDEPVELCWHSGIATHAAGVYPGLRLPSDLAKLDALLCRDCKRQAEHVADRLIGPVLLWSPCCCRHRWWWCAQPGTMPPAQVVTCMQRRLLRAD